jgi:hypothetical protein
MATVQAAKTIREMIRDRENRPFIRDHVPESRLDVDCSDRQFCVRWSPGYLASDAAKAELEARLDEAMRPLLARIFGSDISEKRISWAIKVAHRMLLKADALDPADVTVSLPASTPLQLAEGIRTSIDAVMAERIQTGACAAIAGFLGSLAVDAG